MCSFLSRSLLDESVPAAPCPGAGSSSLTSTLSWLRRSSDHLSSSPHDLHLSFFFFTAYFYSNCFTASSLTPLRFQLFVFLESLNFVLCFLCPHRYCRRVLPVGDWWSLVSEEVLRLMLDGSVKLAIISTAWIETVEQKHHLGM